MLAIYLVTFFSRRSFRAVGLGADPLCQVAVRVKDFQVIC